jgi:hypothetical protein
MTTPSSPIGFSDIYSEANGASPGSATSFKTLASSSYFDGPNGFNTIAYNGWGQSRGNNGIFNVQGLGATPYKFSDYRSIPYYYDQTNTQVIFNFTNNSPGFIGNDFNFTLYYRDSTLTYSYLVAGAFIPNGSPPSTIQVDQPTTPLIYGCNWVLEIDANPPYPTGTKADLTITINGTNLLNPTPINTGKNTFDYTGTGGGLGNEYMQYNWPAGGLTGSYADILIQ